MYKQLEMKESKKKATFLFSSFTKMITIKHCDTGLQLGNSKFHLKKQISKLVFPGKLAQNLEFIQCKLANLKILQIVI